MSDSSIRGHAKPRLRSAERRQLILETTLRMLARDGAEGTSLRGVSREMNVAPSLMRHSFPSWHDLLIAVYDMITERFIARLTWITSAEASSDRVRMAELIRFYLATDWAGDSTIGALMALWQLSRTVHSLRPSFSRFLDDRCNLVRLALERLAQEAGREIDLDETAACFLLFMDGIWLHLSLNPGNIPQRGAEDICWAWLADRFRKPEWKPQAGTVFWPGCREKPDGAGVP